MLLFVSNIKIKDRAAYYRARRAIEADVDAVLFAKGVYIVPDTWTMPSNCSGQLWDPRDLTDLYDDVALTQRERRDAEAEEKRGAAVARKETRNADKAALAAREAV